jgi:hypothetical protein
MANSDLHIISWDIRRAFDSIPKNLVKLAWDRLGIPLDHDGLTFPWTPHMMSHMYAHSDAKLAKDNDHFITSPHLGFVAQNSGV